MNGWRTILADNRRRTTAAGIAALLSVSAQPEAAAAGSADCAGVRQLSGAAGHPFVDLRLQLNPRRGVILHHKGKPVFAHAFWSCDMYGPDAKEAREIAEGGEPDGDLNCTFIATDRAEAEQLMTTSIALFERCAGVTGEHNDTEERSKSVALTKLARWEAQRSGSNGTTEIIMDVTGFPGDGSEIPADSPWVPERFWFSLEIDYEGQPEEEEE
jgi:hypothetical protein